jgi:hypothetical protein
MAVTQMPDRRGHGGKMLAKKVESLRGNKVLAVIDLVSRSGPRVVNASTFEIQRPKKNKRCR